MRNAQAAAQIVTSAITIRDIEGSMSHFSGDDQTKVERWIDKFEDTSELLGWNDLQKVIYAKKLLCGSAKQFIAERDNLLEINEEVDIK